MLRKNHILFYSLVMGVMTACASQPPSPPDTGALAREIIEEELQKAIEAAPEDSLASLPTDSNVAPTDPIWQLSEDDNGLRHLKSGYVCPAQIGDFQMRGEDAFPGLGPGQDVACIYWSPKGGSIKLHLTDFGREVSASAHLKGVTTTISDSHRAVKEIPAPTIPDTLIAQNTVAFEIPLISKLRPEVPMQTAVWIDTFNRWHLKIRATYEADRAPAIASAAQALYARAPQTITPTARIPLPGELDN